MSEEDVRSVILGEIALLREEDGLPWREIQDSEPFASLDLDSLAFAVLIARLEAALGVDPYSAIEVEFPPQTIGGLIDDYCHGVDRVQPPG